MKRSVRQSILVATAAALASGAAQADILAYKQLKQMFRQGDEWRMVFVETLANTGAETVKDVQISADLTPLGSDLKIRLLSSKPLISVESDGSAQPEGSGELNTAFDGANERQLLEPGAELGPGELMQITYSVTTALGNGPYALQSVVSPGDDLSQNGEKDRDRSDDFDTPTYISLPKTIPFSAAACPEGLLESKFNLVNNGDFSIVTGNRPHGEQPLKQASGPNSLLADSFYSDAPYAGDDGFPPDNNETGFYHDPSGNPNNFVNSLAIHQSRVGDGITLYDDTFFQHAFPGDPGRGVPAAPNYLLYNGNGASQPIGVWKQDLTGLKPGATYNFIAYVSNAAWPGLTLQGLREPAVRLVANGQVSASANVPQEAADEQDTWRPVSAQVVAPAGGEMTLTLEDTVQDHIFGDRLAVAQIGLFQCVDPALDDDGDLLSNGVEVALGTDPNSGDSDGDGKGDGAEVGQDINHPLDTDGDGVIDALESSLPGADSDGDGLPDEVDGIDDGPDGDRDADGISNGDELRIGSDPDNADTDGDGKGDAEEVGPDFSKPKDSDGDGIPDILESNEKDSDGDDVPDEYDNFDDRGDSNGGSGGSSGGGSTSWLWLAGLLSLKRWRRVR